MKFEVGDKVTVRDDLIPGTRYYMDNGVGWTGASCEMCALGGQTLTVSVARPGYYQMAETGRLLWVDDMFVHKNVETYSKKCPFCGAERTAARGVNILCDCNAKYYFGDRFWLNRNTGDRVLDCETNECVTRNQPKEVLTQLLDEYAGRLNAADIAEYLIANGVSVSDTSQNKRN